MIIWINGRGLLEEFLGITNLGPKIPLNFLSILFALLQICCIGSGMDEMKLKLNYLGDGLGGCIASRIILNHEFINLLKYL